MRRALFILSLLSSTLFAAETWAPAPDYWGPGDAEGFRLPLDLPKKNASDRPEGAELQVISLNKKGYLHRKRREAEPLGSEPVTLLDMARVYSPGQSFVALKYGDAALLVLHAHSAISVMPADGVWVFTLTGDRGLIRISTREQALALTLQPSDPETAWKNTGLRLDGDSDLYLKYDRDSIMAFTLRGRVVWSFEATRVLESQRPEGLLRSWEEKQIRHLPQKAYELEVHGGQELRMEGGASFQYRIGLPDAASWQGPIARTSPQLTNASGKQPSWSQGLLELRQAWLKKGLGTLTADKENLYRLLNEGRWEEAYELVKNVESDADLEYKALAAICLYRLQQEAYAIERSKGIDPSSIWADITRQEFLRSRLRSKDAKDVNAPADLRHTRIPMQELYLLGSHEQSQRQWRSALDLWERWPESSPLTPLEESYREWRRDLDQNKPWSYRAKLQLGWSDNVLHLPSGLAAPAEIGHRSSWYFRAGQTLPYLVERSEAFSVALEPAFDFIIFQHSGLSDLQRFEPSLALPLSMRLPFAFQSLRLKPFVSRLIQGQGGLDRFGYELGWQLPIGSMSPEFFVQQDQNLDIAPTQDHRLDALSGERIGALDRSVRRHSLGLRVYTLEALWQIWDYRYALSQGDDRQRLQLKASYQKEWPWDLGFTAEGRLFMDTFSGSRSTMTGLDLAMDLSFLYWQRRLPGLSIERIMRQSGDSAQSFTETRFLSGFSYRW